MMCIIMFHKLSNGNHKFFCKKDTTQLEFKNTLAILYSIYRQWITIMNENSDGQYKIFEASVIGDIPDVF